MNTSDNNIPVSLEPPPLVEDPTKSIRSIRHLSEIIPQITLERGSFVNVTEASLLKEIEELSNASSQSPSAGMKDQEAGSPKADLSRHEEEFTANRTELSRLIGTAHNEIAIALDFISLLISSVRPAAGTTSMSPHLQSHVPVGSLGVDRVKSVPQPEDMSVCLGWKTQAMNAACERIAGAAMRLKEESQREKIYWREVEDIAFSGEMLSRIRIPEYRGLGVRYGFGDAGSTYKEQGIATLRKNAEGKIVLKMEGAKRTKILSVVVMRTLHSELIQTGQYSTKMRYDNTAVKAQIKQARDLLFEEELFFLIAQETKVLASKGVTLDFGDKVTIPLQGLKIVLELAELADESGTMDVEQTADDILAESVNVALHLLLSKVHRNNLIASRSIPLPLGKKKVTTESSNILGPLAAALSLPNVQGGIASLLKELVTTFRE